MYKQILPRARLLQAADDEEALRTAKADLWTAWWMRDVRRSSQPLG